MVICLSSGKYQAAPNERPLGTIVTFTNGEKQLGVNSPADDEDHGTMMAGIISSLIYRVIK